MWHENEIIAIFKFYIKFHSVDELKDKKKAYNICNDLLYEYQEDLWNAIENFDIKNCPTEILL